MPRPQIDRDKLRTAIRKLGDEYIFYMLDEAIDLLPEAKLARIAGRYLDPARLRPDGNAKGGLLADIKAFEQASSAASTTRPSTSTPRTSWTSRRARGHGSPSVTAFSTDASPGPKPTTRRTCARPSRSSSACYAISTSATTT